MTSQAHQFFEVTNGKRRCRTCGKQYSVNTATGTLLAHSAKCDNLHKNQPKIFKRDVILINIIFIFLSLRVLKVFF